MSEFKKSPSERDILARLSRSGLALSPLTFRRAGKEAGDGGIDMIAEGEWNGERAVFALECKASSTPRSLAEAMARAKAYAERAGLEPLVIVPFLNDDRLGELERQGVSGIDLCGNGVVIVPGKWAVYRSGAPNRFPSSAPIKKVYQGSSSIVGRVFLAQPRYGAVTEIQNEIRRRSWPAWPPVSLPTVSKVLKALEEDLLVSRGEAGITLLQPDKLLDRLAESYGRDKRERPSAPVKLSVEGAALLERVARAAGELGLPLAATGAASTMRYAVMQRGPVLSVYCTEPEALLDRLEGSRTERFPNLEVVETDEPYLYFDAPMEDGFRWASPVQVYLELMSGDKRDREAAEQVRELILERIRRKLA